MAVDIYDSQYLLILAPSLVIALMFLFFWLFMKETSYDEVLAKQKLQVQTAQAPPQALTPPVSAKKKEKKKQKAEAVENQQPEPKTEQAPPPVKKEPLIVAETKAPDGSVAAPPPTSGKKKNPAKKQKTEPEAKLKELLSGLSSLTLSEAEAFSLVTVLQQKSPSAMEAWHKSVARPDPAAQERERLLSTLQEEASIAKDKVKQLSQELQVEKQKTNRVEAVMREQRAAMEKELGSMQNKAQSNFQELQTMQIKFQQVREQLEGQISHLKQENGILRDAVSSATNQMESKNSAELNKLRSEYAGLMKELADSNSKLQQEEHQRKSLEVNYKQNVSQLEAQLQDAKRRWEELQNFIHSVNAEREKLQASKQELHSQLLTAESEMNNKNKEMQALRSSLNEAMVSKERLEQQVMEFMEASQHSVPDESLQARVQALHNENVSLKAEIQKLQAQISDQAASQLALDQIQKSAREKEENMRTVESLLEKGLIEVANKEEELKTAREENEALRQEVEAVKRRSGEKEASSESTLKELESKIEEKDGTLKSMEESLQRAKDNSSAREKMAQTLEQQLAVLKAEMEQLREEKVSDELSSSAAQLQELQELQAQLTLKDQEIQMLQTALETRTKELVESAELLNQQQQSCAAVPSPEFQTLLLEKEKQVSDLQSELAEMRDSLELHRKKNNELREKNWSAMEALSATESMLQGKLSKVTKENQMALEMSQAECRETLHKLLPNVPLPDEQNHQEWLLRFERAVAESPAAQSTPASGDSEALSEKLREAEEAQQVLQKDCETYKKVLAETEGILQCLQSSVEQEESRWKMKLDQSQGELGEMSQRVAALEQEIERLTDGAELENLRREKQHLESELERAERESATYVTEVRELKTQLTETLSKLETEENERQKVAGDLYKAQQSLDLIQEELSKVTDSSEELIENSSLTSQTQEEMDKKEKLTAGLNQTVKELQQLLQTVSRQLSKGQEG
ncbi:unnamed protein product, partial [Tetraodon nigroviridis]